MDLQLSFWIAGWIVIGLVSFVFICSTISDFVKQIITHYYSTKKAYAQALLEMRKDDGLSEEAAEFWAKALVKSREKDS
jgi:hypothetical protein